MFLALRVAGEWGGCVLRRSPLSYPHAPTRLQITPPTPTGPALALVGGRMVRVRLRFSGAVPGAPAAAGPPAVHLPASVRLSVKVRLPTMGHVCYCVYDWLELGFLLRLFPHIR